MGIHLADQTLSFLWSCLLGAALGILYDVFRILRIAFPHNKIAVFVEDFLFWLLCAFVSYLFLLTSTDGAVRVFLLIGELIGGLLYRYTLGIVVMRVAQAIIDGVKAVLRFLYRFLIYPIWRLFYGIISLLLRPLRFLGRIVKKSSQRMKFRLKVRRLVLYNHYKGYWRQKRAHPGEIPDDEKETTAESP